MSYYSSRGVFDTELEFEVLEFSFCLFVQVHNGLCEILNRITDIPMG